MKTIHNFDSLGRSIQSDVIEILLKNVSPKLKAFQLLHFCFITFCRQSEPT